MRYFTVYERPGGGPADEAFQFVKEGFSWPAAILAPLWLIYEQLWLVLAGYLVLSAAIGALVQAAGMSELSTQLVLTAYGLVFAFEANNLRRWTLERNGNRLVAVVTSRNLREAEHKFISSVVEERIDVPPSNPPQSDHHGQPHSSVLGLFPEPDPS